MKLPPSLKLILALLVFGLLLAATVGCAQRPTTQYEIIYRVPPAPLLEYCVPRKLITIEQYVAMDLSEREKYLHALLADHLLTIGECNAQLRSIRIWGERLNGEEEK